MVFGDLVTESEARIDLAFAGGELFSVLTLICLQYTVLTQQSCKWSCDFLMRLVESHTAASRLLLHDGEDLFAKRVLLQVEAVISTCEAKQLEPADLIDRARIVVYNQIGMFLQHTGKPRLALRFFENVLSLEVRYNLPRAATHQTMCALLAALGRPRRALEHAQRAITELDAQQDPSQTADLRVVALHSMGVQLEHVGRRAEAIAVYRDALCFAKAKLPADHVVLSLVRGSLQAALSAFNAARSDT